MSTTCKPFDSASLLPGQLDGATRGAIESALGSPVQAGSSNDVAGLPDGLLLYHLPHCPYCRKVRRAAAQLDVPLTLVDISRDEDARRMLLAARGRATVPVLRIPTAEGFELLPESDDIVAYLRAGTLASQSAAA